jgi:hypothetical protein
MSVLSKIDTGLAQPLGGALNEPLDRPHGEAHRQAAKERALLDRLSEQLAPKMRPVFEDIHAEIIGLAGKAALASARTHAEVLRRYCQKQSETIAQLTAAEKEFQTRSINAVDTAEEQAAILDFVRALGANAKQVQSDRKALDAFFDADAALERFQKRVGERERALAHGLECLGFVGGDAVAEDPALVQSAFFVQVFDELLDEMRNWRGDARVRKAAHSCLATIAEQVRRWPFGAWLEAVLSATRRVSLDESEDVWVQCASFDALLALSPKSIGNAIGARLAQPLASKPLQIRDKELFLRRHLVQLLARNFGLDEAFRALLIRLRGDESGAVRQSFADILHLLPSRFAAETFAILRDDPDSQVRAAIFADMARMLSVVPAQVLGGHITHILEHDSDEFVLRMGLDAAANLAAQAIQNKLPEAEQVIAELRFAIAQLQTRKLPAKSAGKLMRWADEAHERIWLVADTQAREIAAVIRSATHDQREAQIRPVKSLAPWLADHSDSVGRVMAVMAQNDFGLSLRMGRRPAIQRGEWIKRRFWRILFEGSNSATDKRQAHIHTTGRHYFGTVIAPSARMAELAPTKVPGEPLFESSEGGWRNYLPLVDMILSALDQGEALRIFTSAGVTQIEPPSGLLSRLRAFWHVSRNFASLAEVRNREPSEYCAALRKLGMAISFSAYETDHSHNSTANKAPNQTPNQVIAQIFSCEPAS